MAWDCEIVSAARAQPSFTVAKQKKIYKMNGTVQYLINFLYDIFKKMAEDDVYLQIIFLTFLTKLQNCVQQVNISWEKYSQP